LRFAFQSPRSTKDLDFTVEGVEILDDADRLRDLLDDALRFAKNRFRIKAKCQSIERRPPPNPESTRPTYSIKIAYQFESDRYFLNFEERNNIPTVIPVEISFNDLVCETCRWSGENSVKVSSLEDILAEKMRSLLQQKIRKRNRCQDVYDIARFVRQSAIDIEKIGRFLVQKANLRDIEVHKSSFDDVIREMAHVDYDLRIHEQAPYDFIPFGEAWENVMSLVNSLDIPD
jgi:predicted nucleotidyltransferase component of viral defense system